MSKNSISSVFINKDDMGMTLRPLDRSFSREVEGLKEFVYEEESVDSFLIQEGVNKNGNFAIRNSIANEQNSSIVSMDESVDLDYIDVSQVAKQDELEEMSMVSDITDDGFYASSPFLHPSIFDELPMVGLSLGEESSPMELQVTNEERQQSKFLELVQATKRSSESREAIKKLYDQDEIGTEQWQNLVRAGENTKSSSDKLLGK